MGGVPIHFASMVFFYSSVPHQRKGGGGSSVQGRPDDENGLQTTERIRLYHPAFRGPQVQTWRGSNQPAVETSLRQPGTRVVAGSVHISVTAIGRVTKSTSE